MLVIRCFPRADDAFAARVGTLLAAGVDVARRDARLERWLASVADVLHDEYPQARLVAQDPLARTEDEVVVYAYRDGDARSPGR